MDGYEKAKPIEPGCKAITYNCLNPQNNNIIVTVGSFVGWILGFEPEDIWEVDHYFITTVGSKERLMSESKLLRIDDDEIQEEKATPIAEQAEVIK